MNQSLSIFLLILSLTCQSQVVFHTDFNETSGTTDAKDNISNILFSIQNNFNRPERILSPDDKALRLDGWSTYISHPNFTIGGITDLMTIEAWYATESFNKESASIVELFGNNSGFYLSAGPFGEINFGYHLDGGLEVHNTQKRLTPYQWHHIVATVSLVDNETKIVVDNELWFLSSNLNATTINIPTSTLFIGKRSLNQTQSGFHVNTLNGAIDDIKIYNTALSESEIAAHFNQVSDREADLTIDPSVRHQGDHLRPQYHPMPNTSWANEAYGLIHYNGKYHLFFQKNPNAPQLYFMHWGHLSSPDLVHWTEEKMALRPSAGFDNFGVWSGTAIKDNSGKPVLFYTGVNGAKAGIGSAYPLDEALIGWEEDASNPLIDGPPASVPNMDFRDPFIWKDGGSYYMIVGSGLSQNRGGVLFTYKSLDLVNWTRITSLFSSNNTDDYGVFWEMPTFYQLEGSTYLLQILPTPFNGKPAKSLYFIGKWENEVFTPYHEEAKNLELFTTHLLAPAFGTDEETKNTYIGIIPEDRDANDQVAAGWRQAFSLPRQVRLLTDTTLGHIPHPNLCRLRSNELQVENLELVNGEKNNLPNFRGNQIEMEFEIKADSNSQFAIQILKHADEAEYTTLSFYYDSNKILFDRRQSSLSATTKNLRIGDFIFNPNDTLNIRIFIDHSIVEVFIEDLTVYSGRVYPSRSESDLVDVVGISGSTEVVRARKWDMATIIGHEVQDLSCPPDNLPDSFNKIPKVNPPMDTLKLGIDNFGFHFYPNPSNGIFRVTSGINLDKTLFILHDLAGNEMQRDVLNEDGLVDITELKKGIYVFSVLHGGHLIHNKIIRK